MTIYKYRDLIEKQPILVIFSILFVHFCLDKKNGTCLLLLHLKLCNNEQCYE